MFFCAYFLLLLFCSSILIFPFLNSFLYLIAGVPIELIPSTDTGNIKSVNLKQWMNLRIHLERERQKSAYYSSSSDNDSDNNGCRGSYDSGGVSLSSSSTTSSSSIVTTATTIDISNIVEWSIIQ